MLSRVILAVIMTAAVVQPASAVAAEDIQPQTFSEAVHASQLELAPVAAKGPSNYDCDLRTIRFYVKFPHKDGYDRARSVTFYRACIPYDPQAHTSFVKLLRVIGSYNAYGTTMDCNSFLRRLDGFGINMLYWVPQTGVNYNPSQFNIPCDESTQNFRTQTFPKDTPRLHWGQENGDDAQARAKMTAERQNNHVGNDYKSDWDKMTLFD